MATSLYICDKAVIDVVPYTPRRTVLRLDVGPFAVLYLAIYWAMWRWNLRDGWVVLIALPAVLACHLLVFLSTQWSVRFMCFVSQRRVTSIDDAEVGLTEQILREVTSYQNYVMSFPEMNVS